MTRVPVPPRSTDLYAHQCGQGWYVDFHCSPLGVQHFGPGEVHPVRVTEDPQGPLWGWWSNQNHHHSLIFSTYLSLSTCFTYGVKRAELAGEGEAVRLRAEPRSPHDAVQD